MSLFSDWLVGIGAVARPTPAKPAEPSAANRGAYTLLCEQVVRERRKIIENKPDDNDPVAEPYNHSSAACLELLDRLLPYTLDGADRIDTVPPRPLSWRVGQRVPEHVYWQDTPIFTAPTAALAAQMVTWLNIGEQFRPNRGD